MSPATSPESDMPTISQVTSLAMPPLQYGPAPGPPGDDLCVPCHVFILFLRFCDTNVHTGVKNAAIMQLLLGEWRYKEVNGSNTGCVIILQMQVTSALALSHNVAP